MTLPKAIIVEIDNVLSDDRHRRHFIDGSLPLHGIVSDDVCRGCGEWRDECVCPLTIDHPDFDAYHAACSEDGVNQIILKILQRLSCPDHPDDDPPVLIYITSRPEKYRSKTEYFLYRNNAWNEHYDKLFMRPELKYPDLASMKEGEIRHRIDSESPSHIVKQEAYRAEIEGKYDVLFVLDRGEDAKAWKELGLTVLEVL